MAIFRGVGGSGDSSDNSFLDAVTAQANAASASASAAQTSATSAANSLAAIQETEITSASFDTSDGVLTLTKTGGATVTADLDGRFLTTHQDISGKANLSGDTFTGEVVLEGNSTDLVFNQNSASGGSQEIRWENKTDNSRTGFIRGNYTLETSIGRSQVQLMLGTTPTTLSGDGITRLGILAGGDINFYSEDGSSAKLRWDASEERLGLGTTVPSETLDVVGNIAVSGTVDGVDIAGLNTTVTSLNTAVAGKANLSGAIFTGNVNVGSLGTSPTLQVYGTTSLFSGLNVTGDISVTGTVDGRDVATDGTKLDGIETGADVTDTANVTSAGAAMLDSSPTFTGTITAPNVDISKSGSVTTNISTGQDSLGSNTKVLNLGTGYTGGTTTINMGGVHPNTTNTINIGQNSNSTVNLSGSLEIDGTLSDNNDNVYERTVRTRFQRRGYTNTVAIYTLTTGYAQLANSLRIDSGVTTAVEHVLDLNINALFNDINSSNEAVFVVTVTAPSPSSEDTINMGTVLTSAFGQFTVSGDFTKHFSPYCGLSRNSDGSNAINFSNQQGWQYDPVTDRTTIYVYGYQSNVPTTGDTAYLHPFDWETSGTEINGDEYPIEAYNASGVVHQNQFHNIYLGYYKPSKTFKIKAKESTSSENVQICRVAGTYSQIIGN